MKPQPKIGRLTFEFLSQDDAELSCVKNEKVVILENSGDGWSYCHRLLDPTAQGYVPTGYLEIVENEKPPTDIIYETDASSSSNNNVQNQKVSQPTTNNQKTEISDRREQEEMLAAWGDDYFEAPKNQKVLTNVNPVSTQSEKVSSQTNPTYTRNPVNNQLSSGENRNDPRRVTSSTKSSIPTNAMKKENPVSHQPKPNPAKPIFKKDQSSRMLQIFRKYHQFLRFRRYYSFSKKYRKQRNRLLQILETISTEENYLRQMTFCLDEVKKPLLDQKLITDQQSKTLFSNMKEIQGLNKMLLDDLQKQRDQMPKLRIASCFSRISPFFKMYHVYVNNFEISNDLLDLIKRKDSRIVKFDESITKKPGSDQLAIKDFFLVPVMRIPRYKLLLGHVLKYTESDHEEYEELKKAHDVVSKVAEEVNVMKRWKHQTGVAIEISKVLKGRYDSLIQPHRKFVSQVKVKLKSKEKSLSRFTSFKCYLFSDLIIFLEGDSVLKMRSPRAALVFLVSTKVSKLKKDQVTLKTVNGGKIINYLVQFTGSGERDKWICLFEKYINEKVKAVQSKSDEAETEGGRKKTKKNEIISPANLIKTAQLRTKMLEKSRGPRKIYESEYKKFLGVEEDYQKLMKKFKQNQERLKFVGEKIGKLMMRRGEIDNVLNQDKEKIETEIKSNVLGHNVVRQDKEFFHIIGNEENKFREIFDTDPIFKILE